MVEGGLGDALNVNDRILNWMFNGSFESAENTDPHSFRHSVVKLNSTILISVDEKHWE